jgi:hypothetical protein
VLLLVVILTAVPKSYFHDSSSHHHQFSPEEHQHTHGKTELSDDNNCSFEKFDYSFSYLFLEFPPIQPEMLALVSTKNLFNSSFFLQTSVTLADLRAPPVV